MKELSKKDKNIILTVGSIIVSLVGIYIVLTLLPQLFIAVVFFVVAYILFPSKSKLREFFGGLFGRRE